MPQVELKDEITITLAHNSVAFGGPLAQLAPAMRIIADGIESGELPNLEDDGTEAVITLTPKAEG